MCKFKTSLLVFSFFIFSCFFFAFKTSAVYFASQKVILYEEGKRITDSSVFHDKGNQTPVCKKGICYIGQQYEVVTFYKTDKEDVLNYNEWVDNWYLTHEGCEGFATKEDEIYKALEKWRQSDEYLKTQKRVSQTSDMNERERLWEELKPKRSAFMKEKGFEFYDNPECEQIDFSDYGELYLNGLKEKAFYSKTISFPPPEGGLKGYCNGEICMGGRIGTPRTLKVDLKKGTYEEVAIDTYRLTSKIRDLFGLEKVGLLIAIAAFGLAVFSFVVLKKVRRRKS
ncbi:hypothetical protein AMJ51_02055 [Microgenomates bacterium DG_75]|nr:MAG: hypothetical protein AMJ51_02055 [Microgenomates bacterium DG_75]